MARGVVIVPTGVANMASVGAALKRAGAEVSVAQSAEDVRTAPCVVMPGVGSFAAGIAALRQRGVDQALRERVEHGEPTLAICLGLQLLCEASDEAPGERGMGVIPGRIEKFRARRVPQIGWNEVSPDGACRVLSQESMYFANSYRLGAAPRGWGVAWAEYGGRFVAALERGPVVACQFHPELSGALGLSLIRRWLTQARAAAC